MEQACSPVDYDRIVSELLINFPDRVAKAVENPRYIKWFVGQGMVATHGKANPVIMQEKFTERLMRLNEE